MAQLVIETRAIAITGAAALIALAVAATIGYNIGYGRGALTRQVPGTVNDGLNLSAAPSSQASSPVPPAPEELALSGEPIEVSGKTVLSGIVKTPTAAGFTLEVQSLVVNTKTGQQSTKTATYEVAITKSTQIVQQTTAITVPSIGAIPQVNTSTKKVAASAITDGDQVSITTDDPVSAKILTALEVRLSESVRK